MSRRPSAMARLAERMLYHLKLKMGMPVRRVVGRDHLGNVYYVAEGGSEHIQIRRGYIPGNRVYYKRIPVEWNAWLSGRRDEPPTQREIDRNMAISAQIAERAAKLTEEEARARPPAVADGPSPSPVPVNRPNVPLPLAADEQTRKRFPVYNEYEKEPGYKEQEKKRPTSGPSQS